MGSRADIVRNTQGNVSLVDAQSRRLDDRWSYRRSPRDEIFIKVIAWIKSLAIAPREVRKMIFSAGAGGFAVSLIVTGVRIYDASGPALVLTRAAGEVAIVHGTDVDLRVHAMRTRPPCPDAKADRQMVHVPDGVDPDSGTFDDLEFIREDRVVLDKNGHDDFNMMLTLARPLRHHPTGGWWYQANIYNGCGWFSRIFGAERPIPAPATPVREIPTP